jgi:hypothetical protein
MRGMGTKAPRKGPVSRGLIRCVPLVYLCFLSACGSDLQRQQGVTPTAVINVSGGPVYDFGSVSVDTFADRELTITNIGAMKATELTASFYFSVNFAFAGGSFPGEGGTCTSELLPREHCTITVRFSPHSTGTLDAFLPISFFDGSASRTNSDLMLRGKGIGATTGP